MRRESPALALLHRTTLEARRTRNGAPASRLQSIGGFGTLKPASWQTNPAALAALVKAVKSARAYRGGSLGAASPYGEIGGTVGSVIGGKAGSAISTAGTGAAAGSMVMPVIGTAIGAAVGLLAGYLMGAKHYFNVGNSNAVCQQVEAAWQKYLSIQGHMAGRALGLPTMIMIFHGAVGAGLFPGNAMHLSFHEGTLACAGHGNWADSFLGETLQGKPVSCAAHNCLPDAVAKLDLASVPSGTPTAVYLIDDILLPMNAHDPIPWVYAGAQNPQVHQLLYDLADAYLAVHVSGTVPYVEYPASQVQSTAGAVGAPSTTATSSAIAPSGMTQVGTDPATGTAIYSNGSALYEMVNGTLQPYTQSSAASGYPSGYPSTYSGGAIPSAYSGGSSQTAAAPAGSVAAASVGGFSLSPTLLLLAGVGLVAAFGYAYMTEKGKGFADRKRIRK